MNKLLAVNQTTFVRVRADQLKTDLLQQATTNIPDTIATSLALTQKMFSDLSSPLFQGMELGPLDVPDINVFADGMLSIQHDISLSYENVNTLRVNMDAEFNSTSSALDNLDKKAATIAETVKSISIGNDAEEDVFVAGNDFNDADWIDPDYAVDSGKCFLDASLGGITLPMSSENVNQTQNATISIVRSNKSLEGPPKDIQSPVEFFHEGQFYAMQGKAIPAGGKWNLEVVPITEMMTEDNAAIYEEANADITAQNDLAFATRILNGTTILDGKELLERPRFLARLQLPDEATLRRSRNALIDGAQDTFWQCEWVFIPGRASQENLDVSPKQSAEDYFEVEFLIDFGQHFDTNKLVIDPVVFQTGERLEVVKIATSESREEIPQPLDFKGAGIYSDQLSEFPDRPVEDQLIDGTFSPTSSSPSWRLAWSFASRRIRFVNLTLRQRSAYITPYQTLYVKMSRTAKAVTALEEV